MIRLLLPLVFLLLGALPAQTQGSDDLDQPRPVPRPAADVATPCPVAQAAPGGGCDGWRMVIRSVILDGG